MTGDRRFVIVQTAFPGDVVLTLPLAQALKKHLPDSYVGFVATPQAAELLRNHPAISEILVYDKRGRDRGARGIRDCARRLREKNFDAALVPHRSIRSALAVRFARIPRRVGFSTSAGRVFFSEVVRYDPGSSEISRNLSLLGPFGIGLLEPESPSLYPGSSDMATVDSLVRAWHEGRGDAGRRVALAPGSVWATKRWPAAHFQGLAKLLVGAGYALVLVGGEEDRTLCDQIAEAAGPLKALNAAGSLTLLQSAELLRRCEILVTNDSAPMHLASAMRVPVLALFGPTVPSFGFAPSGPRDVVVEKNGLLCRPCSRHGGTKCPIGTFECMIGIPPVEVFRVVESILGPTTTL